MSDISDTYMQYAEALYEKTDLESKLRGISRLTDDLKHSVKSTDQDGSCGIEITAHAAKNILKRLESLSSESSVIYKDVMNASDPASSLIWPTNMEAFIIGILAKAKESKNVEVKPSKNSNCSEYHYNVEIKKWSTDSKKLIFTGIVEDNNIKTGFFNWAQ